MPGQIYEAGHWEVDLGRRELRTAGVPVPIGPRAFEVIEALVQSAGDLVTKDEIMGRIWPGAIVEENTLQVHIFAVRRAFGSDRGMLKTVSGRGYRLVGGWRVQQENEPATEAQRVLAPLSASPVQSNLPLPSSQLIGRSVAVRHLRDLLTAYRVVTLAGPGGIGKTRLAIEVARDLLSSFGGDGWLVDLVRISDPGLVPAAVVGAIGLQLDASELSFASVARAVGERKLLLVFDNCEHVIDAAARMAETIVRMCPGATILATSRETLQVDGECVYRVPVLDVPPVDSDAVSDLLESSAVSLLIARIQAQNTGFSPNPDNLPTIAAICRRLDGIPLAIEFAAARAATLGLEKVLSRLASRFELLTSGRRTALPRHQTLRATLDWSYELLTESECALLRRLAVFAGGFTLEGATAMMRVTQIPQLDVTECLASLVAKSLVVSEEASVNYRLRLLETTRAYALEKLVEAGEDEQAQRCHAIFFRDLFAPNETRSLMQPTSESMPAYVSEIDNVRAALDWAFSPQGDSAIGIVLTAAYVPAWLHLALVAECRERAECALNALDAGSNLSPNLNLQMHIALGVAIYPMVGEFRMAQAAAERYALLAKRSGDPFRIVMADHLMGQTLHFRGHQQEAQHYLARVLDSQSSSTDQPQVISFLYNQKVAARSILARTLCVRGFVDQAKRLAQDNFEEAYAKDDKLSVCYTLARAGGRVALMTGDFTVAEQAVTILIDLSARLRMPFWHQLADCLNGELWIRRGESEKGCKLLRAALDTMLTSRRALHHVGFLYALAEGLGATGQVAAGLATIADAFAHSERDGERWCEAELYRVKGELLCQPGGRRSLSSAEDCFQKALGVARDHGALLWELRAAQSLARLRLTQQRLDEARQILAPVYDRFTEGFDTHDLRTARAFLAAL